MHQRLLAAGAALLLAGSAGAVTLAPGGFIASPPGATAAAQPWLAGTVVQDRLTRFSYTGWYTDLMATPETTYGAVTGTVQSRVVKAVDGTYDFYWRITVDSGSFLPIAGFALNGLVPATYNADWRRDGVGTVSPATISESGSGSVDFAFGQYLPPSTEVTPGQSSYFLMLDTTAHAYTSTATFSLFSERDSGGSMMIDWGGSSGAYSTFAPAWRGMAMDMAVAVPEPGTVSLAALGLVALGALVRRRRRR